ncbi:MAG: hypothetical protein E7300_12025 [Lachnospiraceae bacterium]|nr:hypothetical protein [Lachnospiraceae bacterium]
MVDLSEKSKEEIFREKKEAELREAKRKEGEWKRRMDKERKCMIGGTFLKYFKDALLFENDEWDRIVQAVIATDAFTKTVEEIRKEAASKPKEEKPEDVKAKKPENGAKSVKTDEKPKSENVTKPTTQADKSKDDNKPQEQKSGTTFSGYGQGQVNG